MIQHNNPLGIDVTMFVFLKKLFKTHPRQLSFYGRSDTGRVRSHNEDSFCSLRNRRLFIVADGMGGHRAGEVASRLAIESLLEFLGEELLKSMKGNDLETRHNLIKAFHFANQTVMQKAAENPSHQGMGSTMVACLFDNASLHVCHVGDARCYITENGNLVQVTTDHTGLAVIEGSGHPAGGKDKTRTVLTMAIGFPFPQDPEYHKIKLETGMRVLLCSDGLWNMLDRQRIEQILLGAATPEEATEVLVADANNEGGRDNITALVIFC